MEGFSEQFDEHFDAGVFQEFHGLRSAAVSPRRTQQFHNKFKRGIKIDLKSLEIEDE